MKDNFQRENSMVVDPILLLTKLKNLREYGIKARIKLGLNELKLEI